MSVKRNYRFSDEIGFLTKKPEEFFEKTAKKNP